ncbi:MAG: response regulator [Candidatus Zixiibacteriota bacterium]
MGKFKILFVDDEEELVSTMVERLEFRDIESAYELNGASAIERLRKEDFDIVILDLKLPGISGEETLRVVKKEHPRLPVILITGHLSAEEQGEIPKGAADYLTKPINIDDLIGKIQDVFDKQ